MLQPTVGRNCVAPSRARGSKPFALIICVSRHRRASRARRSKRNGEPDQRRIDRRAFTGVDRNVLAGCARCARLPVAPSRARGSKRRMTSEAAGVTYRAFTGAWIETPQSALPGVAAHGRVDETPDQMP